MLAWTWQLEAYGKLGTAVSFLFVACAALRLARFNVDVAVVSKRFFIGLPSPAAGCTLAAFVVFVPYLPDFMLDYLPQMTLFLSILAPLLMVSRVRYFSFKEYGLFFWFCSLVRRFSLCLLLFSCILSAVLSTLTFICLTERTAYCADYKSPATAVVINKNRLILY